MLRMSDPNVPTRLPRLLYARSKTRQMGGPRKIWSLISGRARQKHRNRFWDLCSFRDQNTGRRPHCMERDPNLSKGFVPTELWRFVRQIRFPTLYALGADNRIVAPETQQKLRSVLPHVQIVVLPGRGHYPDQERPQSLFRLCRLSWQRSESNTRLHSCFSRVEESEDRGVDGAMRGHV